MIKYDKHGWPQLSIGTKRTRLYWFGDRTWEAAWAEIYHEHKPARVMGHVWWLSFWVTKYHITLSVGSWIGKLEFRRLRKGAQ